jgi:nitroreductase
VVIVACAELGQAGFTRSTGEPSTNKGEYWFMFDVGLAMQNLLLVAHSLGLGTVIIGSFDAKKAETILGVPPGFCVVAMTPLGYPDQALKQSQAAIALAQKLDHPFSLVFALALPVPEFITFAGRIRSPKN